ncbi:MAG: type II secretion system protein [Phycisphaerales bacterium]|jgi:prepilin-type N-terminal cleavage/methylation domain-containing protein/prepilin-type processing-associated H-X9-DG protein|nr:type II secretion system protein [Phycisphaerales bacterium]
MTKQRQRGFSIVELIAVIAIIGLLIGLVYPALKASRLRSMKTQELHLISQVGKSWLMYSIGHQEKILPGYLSTGVQEYDELAWAFPDESIIPPAPLYDSSEPNDAGPWTWRLLDYLDNDWRSLLFYRDVNWDNSEGQLIDHSGVIATQPAFGYNGYYLGGWWEIDNHSGRPEVEFNSVTLTDDRVINVVATVASQLKKSNKQIVFCSTFLAQEGIYDEYTMDNETPGTYFATPSVLARVQQWKPIGSGRVESMSETFVPLGRFNGMPSICFADGHVGNIETDTLVDQSMWIPKAQQVGDIPPSDFSHTY